MPLTLSAHLALRFISCTLYFIMASMLLQAQQWKNVNPPANPFNRQIHATVTGREGVVYAAGDFTNSNHEYVVETLVNNEWTELGAGSGALRATNSIYALAAAGGKVYAAGAFTNVAGHPYVAQFSNGQWSELRAPATSSQFNNTFYALAADKNGNVYAAGSITDASGAYYVARWNGTAWAPMGSGATALNANGYVYALAIDSSGNVYAGGQFTNTSGKRYVAKWNGTTWSEMGTGGNALSANSYITSIEVSATGQIVAAGDFKNSSGFLTVSKWNGTGWAALGSNGLNTDGTIRAITLDRNGNIYAAGNLADGPVNSAVYRWNGASWAKAFEVPSLLSVCAINAMDIDASGNIFLGGTCVNGSSTYYVAKWNGSTVNEPGRNGKSLPASNGVEQIAVGANGHVYAIGYFQNAGGREYIAHWDGQTWSELGGDTASLPVDHMRASMTADSKGNLYVSSIAKNAANHYYIAKWDGRTWSELGGPSSPVHIYEPARAMTIGRNGNLYVAGAFGDSSRFSYGVMKWDGTQAFYYTGYIDPVSLCVDSTGNIYCGNGIWDGSGFSVAKYNEQGWSTLGSGPTALNSAAPITSLAIDKNGYVLAGSLNNQGFSTHSKFVGKWNGTTWSATDANPGSPYSDGRVYAMTSDKFGNVYAAAHSWMAPRYDHIAKWNGQQWSEVGDNDSLLNGEIRGNTVVTDTNGNIYVGGFFGMFYPDQTVGVYEVNRAIDTPESPVIEGRKADYCGNENVQQITITNFPDTVSTEVVVTIDATIIPFVTEMLPADTARIAVCIGSQVMLRPRKMALGQHTLTVKFTRSNYSETSSVIFSITEPVNPVLRLSASPGQVNTEAESVTISAVSEAGGGSTPLFTFAKTAAMDIPLQAESTISTLRLATTDLLPGTNWIYVRMRSSETCVTTATTTDSIRVERSGLAVLVDPDYPGVRIGTYPNPVGSNLTISGLQETKTYSVRLVSATGVAAMERKFSNLNTATIFIHSLPGNMYWLHLYDATKNRRIGTVMILKK